MSLLTHLICVCTHQWCIGHVPNAGMVARTGNILYNKAADTIQTEGPELVKLLQLLSYHLLQLHQLYHNQQDWHLLQLKIQHL